MNRSQLHPETILLWHINSSLDMWVGGSVLCIIVNCWQPTDMKTQGEIPTQHYKSQTHSSSYPRYTGHRNSLMEIFIVLTSEGKMDTSATINSLTPLSSFTSLAQYKANFSNVFCWYCWYTPYLFIYYIFCWCVPSFLCLLVIVLISDPVTSVPLHTSMIMVIYIHIFLNNLK